MPVVGREVGVAGLPEAGVEFEGCVAGVLMVVIVPVAEGELVVVPLLRSRPTMTPPRMRMRTSRTPKKISQGCCLLVGAG